MPAGSLVFFSPHSVHGSKPNASDERRRALVLTYQPGGHRMFKVDAIRDAGRACAALDLVEVLHPTAAVAGTPTQAALEVIRRVEPFDRGRYAGPVGWIDANGDGEWAIALRCAQFDVHGEGDIALTAHAGAGIVAGSDPETEMLETRVKFRPIVDALA